MVSYTFRFLQQLFSATKDGIGGQAMCEISSRNAENAKGCS